MEIIYFKQLKEFIVQMFELARISAIRFGSGSEAKKLGVIDFRNLCANASVLRIFRQINSKLCDTAFILHSYVAFHPALSSTKTNSQSLTIM